MDSDSISDSDCLLQGSATATPGLATKSRQNLMAKLQVIKKSPRLVFNGGDDSAGWGEQEEV